MKIRLFVLKMLIMIILCVFLINSFGETVCFVAQRQVGETALNDTSSRSHQIIRLVIITFSFSEIAPHEIFS